MLRKRVITALVLLALLLPALMGPSLWPFALLTLLFVGAAGWEWGRLNALSAPVAVALGLGVAALGGVFLWSGAALTAAGPAWWLGTAVWGLGGAWALRAGPSIWPRLPKALRAGLGVVMLVGAWIALNRAKAQGTEFILSIFCLVWTADIAAYFGGRAFGRRKLAPSISPGKSWEGAWCGMAAAAVLAMAWIAIDRQVPDGGGSLFSLLFAGFGGLGLVLAVVGLVGLSIVGDLFESLVKRGAGAKDSSQLLPGHGGVLDRIDALLPVFPAALALYSLT